MDPWCKEHEKFKDRNIDPDFIKYPWALFNRLGELDFDKLERQNQCVYDDMKRERFQYISYNSLSDNLHYLTGIKNKLFSKMLYLWLSDNAQLSQPISYK